MMAPSFDSHRSRHKPSRVAPADRAPPASPGPCRGSAKIRQFPVVFVPLPPLLAPLMVTNTAVICVNRSLITTPLHEQCIFVVSPAVHDCRQGKAALHAPACEIGPAAWVR